MNGAARITLVSCRRLPQWLQAQPDVILAEAAEPQQWHWAARISCFMEAGSRGEQAMAMDMRHVELQRPRNFASPPSTQPASGCKTCAAAPMHFPS